MQTRQIKELLRELDRPLKRAKRKTVAFEDPNGVVHIVDEETGNPRMSMLRADYDALRSWKR